MLRSFPACNAVSVLRPYTLVVSRSLDHLLFTFLKFGFASVVEAKMAKQMDRSHLEP